MKSILVSRPSFLILVLFISLGLAACERPLEEEEEPPVTVPPTKVSAEENEETFETPDASEELFLPEVQGADGTSSESEAAPAVPDSAPESAIEAAAPAGHVVQAGDSLFTVAQQYNVSLDDLAVANGLDANAPLSPGTTIIIPGLGPTGADTASSEASAAGGEQVHIVQAGENLYRIGLVYGFTIEELASYNNLENPDYLDVGQEIRIPPGETP